MVDGIFATSVSCIDGRIQVPLAKWIKEKYTVDFIDIITEPGIDKILSDNVNLDYLKSKIEISLNSHKSKLIIVSGHYDCAGNPASYIEHIMHIKNSTETVSSWNLDAKVIGLWVDEFWQVNTI